MLFILFVLFLYKEVLQFVVFYLYLVGIKTINYNMFLLAFYERRIGLYLYQT